MERRIVFHRKEKNLINRKQHKCHNTANVTKANSFIKCRGKGEDIKRNCFFTLQHISVHIGYEAIVFDQVLGSMCQSVD